MTPVEPNLILEPTLNPVLCTKESPTVSPVLCKFDEPVLN